MSLKNSMVISMGKKVNVQILSIAFAVLTLILHFTYWRTGVVVCLVINLGIAITIFFQSKQKQRINDFLITQIKDMTVKNNVAPSLQKDSVSMLLYANQINPHFLYNTLDSIRGQALIGEQKEIALMTEKLSRFFRYYISSRGHIVRLSDEIDNIQDYFVIQKYRFGDRIHLHLQVEDEDVLSCYIPKLTMQPIIENALAHGLEKHTREGNIWVKVRRGEKNIHIDINDDGVGIPLKKLWEIREALKADYFRAVDNEDGHSGIAIQNVNARIQLCFGSEYGLNYRSIAGTGTNVEIVIPIVDDFSRVQLENRLRDATQ